MFSFLIGKLRNCLGKYYILKMSGGNELWSFTLCSGLHPLATFCFHPNMLNSFTYSTFNSYSVNKHIVHRINGWLVITQVMLQWRSDVTSRLTKPNNQLFILHICLVVFRLKGRMPSSWTEWFMSRHTHKVSHLTMVHTSFEVRTLSKQYFKIQFQSHSFGFRGLTRRCLWNNNFLKRITQSCSSCVKFILLSCLLIIFLLLFIFIFLLIFSSSLYITVIFFFLFFSFPIIISSFFFY
jgi:ABC-type multidrug transport system fused ATPase/permease subunit